MRQKDIDNLKKLVEISPKIYEIRVSGEMDNLETRRMVYMIYKNKNDIVKNEYGDCLQLFVDEYNMFENDVDDIYLTFLLVDEDTDKIAPLTRYKVVYKSGEWFVQADNYQKQEDRKGDENMKKVVDMTPEEIRDFVESELRKQGVLELWGRGSDIFTDNKKIGAEVGVIMPNDTDEFNSNTLDEVLVDFDNDYYIYFNKNNKSTKALMNNTTESFRALLWTAKDGWIKY